MRSTAHPMSSLTVTLALFFVSFLTLCSMTKCRSDDSFWKSVRTCTFVMHGELVMQEKRNVLVTQNVTCQDWPLKLFLSDTIT